MKQIHKKLVVDELGKPQEVLIPWEEFKEIEETLGLDLDSAAVQELEQARRDRADGNLEAFIELDEL